MRRALTFLLLVLVTVPAAANRAPAKPEVPGTFPRPAELEPDIEFWRRIYSEVTTNGGLVHDARHLEVVYEVVQFPDDATPRERRERVREAKRRYREILRTLAQGKRDYLTDAEKRVLNLWPADVTDPELQRAAHRIRFQLGQADKFRAGLVRSGAWEGHIRQTLRDMGLPVELAALPHVESSFNPKARSRVGAAGLWQFTRSTGRRYMRIDHVVDERLDPYISTVAAARLLKHNLSVLGTWSLAITAYNHGAAGMRRAIRERQTRDIADIVHNYNSPTFGFASRNFYVAFLAAMDVDFHAEKYFGDLDRDDPAEYETVEIPDFMTPETLADALGVKVTELRRCNPALADTVWDGSKFVPRNYELRVPADSDRKAAKQLLAQVEPSKRYIRQRPDRYHRVRRGQTLSMIASRYNVGVNRLVHLNGLRSRNFIRAGQVLRLPGANVSVPSIAAASNGGSAADGATYKVQRGDTLSAIAQRHGVAPGRLVRMNGLTDADRLYPGQTLTVALSGGATDTASDEPAGARQRDEAPANDERASGPGASPPAGGTDKITDETTGNTGRGSPDDAAAASAEAVEEAQPTSPEEAEAIGPSMPAARHPELSADPSDYGVADDATIEVQAAETLGHYAEWLDTRASRLRRVNGMSYGQPVVVGHRLKLDFSEVDPSTFEKRRVAYHRLLQNAYFKRYRIAGVSTHRVRPGDSLWTLAQRHENVPVWLLRQYNPDLDFEHLQIGMSVRVPEVKRQPDDADDGARGDQIARR